MRSFDHLIEPRVLAMLEALKSAEFDHLNGSARDHLLGVHDILARWNCAPDTCVAGLFHNVYGTESFKPQAVSLDQRHQIAAVIGTPAEALAYWFCVSRRMSFFARQYQAAPCIWDEVHRRRVAVSPAQLTALADIEAANLLEQYSPQLQAYPERLQQSAAMMRWMLEQAGVMSPPAAGALGDLLQTIERDRLACAALRA
jgi:hypothetical protein